MNNPEYTTSAPVIGPLIMCSGLDVSANPYETRNKNKSFFVSRAFALDKLKRVRARLLKKSTRGANHRYHHPRFDSDDASIVLSIPFSFASLHLSVRPSVGVFHPSTEPSLDADPQTNVYAPRVHPSIDVPRARTPNSRRDPKSASSSVPWVSL